MKNFQAQDSPAFSHKFQTSYDSIKMKITNKKREQTTRNAMFSS